MLATPIRPEFEDYPGWHYDSKGMFSVKSVYRLYVRKRDAAEANSSGDTEDS